MSVLYDFLFCFLLSIKYIAIFKNQQQNKTRLDLLGYCCCCCFFTFSINKKVKFLYLVFFLLKLSFSACICLILIKEEEIIFLLNKKRKLFFSLFLMLVDWNLIFNIFTRTKEIRKIKWSKIKNIKIKSIQKTKK